MTHRPLLAVLALVAGTAILLSAGLDLHETRAVAAANAHLGRGELERADAVLAAAIERLPGSPRLHAERSRTQRAIGLWRDDPLAAERALTELAVAAAANPLDGRAWGEYGEALRRADRPSAAVAAIRSGLARDPNNVYLLGLLGHAQLDAGAPAHAVVTLERAQAIRTTRPVGLLLDRARAAAGVAEATP